MLIIMLAVLAALAAILAVLLARQLSKPIEAITRHIKELAAGKYGARLIPMSSDELGRLAVDTNRLAAALEQHETARRRWIADVSHELRTPIAVLRGEVEAVQDGIRENDDDFVHSVGIEVKRLSKLVDDLYQLSMSDIGALNYRFEPCPVAAVLEEAVAQFQGRLDECGISVRSTIEAGVMCHGDKQRLAQLFANLLENTCRYTERPGTLEVELRADGDTISIDLADSAPGISDDEGRQLFEPLYRGERSRSRERGGAGLGLSICRKIVEAHRGTIVARPSAMGGVAIHIELPAID
jgi:two-component system sensor histidine kinase BaeS